MKARTSELRFSRLLPAWRDLRKCVPHFGPIRNDEEYARMHALMEQILDQVGEDEDHPLADFLDVVSSLVHRFEESNHANPESPEPQEMLRFLMELHGVKQASLKEELGTQSVASEILAGKRKINVRQAKALAKRFSVSPTVFI